MQNKHSTSSESIKQNQRSKRTQYSFDEKQFQIAEKPYHLRKHSLSYHKEEPRHKALKRTTAREVFMMNIKADFFLKYNQVRMGPVLKIHKTFKNTFLNHLFQLAKTFGGKETKNSKEITIDKMSKLVSASRHIKTSFDTKECFLTEDTAETLKFLSNNNVLSENEVTPRKGKSEKKKSTLYDLYKKKTFKTLPCLNTVDILEHKHKDFQRKTLTNSLHNKKTERTIQKQNTYSLTSGY